MTEPTPVATLEPIKIQLVEEIDQLLRGSQDKPLLIFKHSLICPTSTAAFERYQRFLAGHDVPEATFTLVEIQRARDVSKRIAELTGVKHESPQAILVRKGQPVWDASHWAITEDSLAEAFAS